ncbi:unnamed protein product [Oppiella nova]|uniref:Ubiquitin-conjugating enzyme E2 Z n=2 Tax=Oppiella nova TaxID=334625 RepID=A0A7R9M2Q7_9ACAR|nr:unnamed protein product [Oppiella nova]CAG2169453.1 unnamed protein product [Oppiella nova]
MTHMSERHILRIQKDIREFYREDSRELYAVCEEEDMSQVHALILGPIGTPYEKGFFYFTLKYGRDYPIKPPNVKLHTTDACKVRFNPNLYACGKVCLSILGTWQGPPWTAAVTLFTTLLSIQSLMNEKPYHNEPGYEERKGLSHALGFGRAGGRSVDQCVRDYNDIIAYETIRVAVVGMLSANSTDAKNMPKMLKDVMIASFRQNYPYFESTVRSRQDMDGKPCSDPFRDHLRPSTFQYKQLLESLLKLKAEYGISGGAAEGSVVPALSQQPNGPIDDEISIVYDGTAAAGTSSPAPTCSAAAAAPIDTKDDPLVKEYYAMADTMISKGESHPRPPKPEDPDEWQKIIDYMNGDIDEDEDTSQDLVYESDSEGEGEGDHEMHSDVDQHPNPQQP